MRHKDLDFHVEVGDIQREYEKLDAEIVNAKKPTHYTDEQRDMIYQNRLKWVNKAVEATKRAWSDTKNSEANVYNYAREVRAERAVLADVVKRVASLASDLNKHLNEHADYARSNAQLNERMDAIENIKREGYDGPRHGITAIVTDRTKPFQDNILDEPRKMVETDEFPPEAYENGIVYYPRTGIPCKSPYHYDYMGKPTKETRIIPPPIGEPVVDEKDPLKAFKNLAEDIKTPKLPPCFFKKECRDSIEGVCREKDGREEDYFAEARYNMWEEPESKYLPGVMWILDHAKPKMLSVFAIRFIRMCIQIGYGRTRYVSEEDLLKIFKKVPKKNLVTQRFSAAAVIRNNCVADRKKSYFFKQADWAPEYSKGEKWGKNHVVGYNITIKDSFTELKEYEDLKRKENESQNSSPNL